MKKVAGKFLGFKGKMSLISAEPYWCNIVPKLDSQMLTVNYTDINNLNDNFFLELSLVLSAKYLPHQLKHSKSGYQLRVPVLLASLVIKELEEYLAEIRQVLAPPVVRVQATDQTPLLFLLLLITLHGLRMQWWDLANILPHNFLAFVAKFVEFNKTSDWLTLGKADSFLILYKHEWYRAISALFLHSDSQHLFSNVLFGALFLIPLCRVVGSGAALVLVTLGGFLGNILNSLLQGAQHLSVGFSGALFSAAGALAGLLVYESLQTFKQSRFGLTKAFVAVAAAFAFVGMLGTEGARTDVGGHFTGMLAGIFLAIAFSYLKHLLLRVNNYILPNSTHTAKYPFISLNTFLLLLAALLWIWGLSPMLIK